MTSYDHFYHIISSRILREKIGAGDTDCQLPVSGKEGYYVFKDKIYEVIGWKDDRPCLKESDISIEKLIYDVYNDKITDIIYFSLYIRKYDDKSFIGFDPTKHKDIILYYLKKKAENGNKLFTSDKTKKVYLDSLGTFENLEGPSGKKNKYSISDIRNAKKSINMDLGTPKVNLQRTPSPEPPGSKTPITTGEFSPNSSPVSSPRQTPVIQELTNCNNAICTLKERFDGNGKQTYLKKGNTYELQVEDDKNYQINFDDDSAIVIETLSREANNQGEDNWKIDIEPPYKIYSGQIRKKATDELLEYVDKEDYEKHDFDEIVLKKIKYGNYANPPKAFAPLDYQFHTLKYSGNKILLAHNPGFGKTINALLLANKFRNQEIQAGRKAPKILIIAPDKAVLKQWAEETKKMFPEMYNEFFWCTYKHFELSETNTDYPEWQDLIDDTNGISEEQKNEMKLQYDKDELNLDNLIGKKIANLDFLKNSNGYLQMHKLKPKPKPKPRDERQPPIPQPNTTSQSELRFCEICRKGRMLKAWGKDLIPDDYTRLKNMNKTISHILDDNKTKTKIDLKWRLVEDKLFLACRDCLTQMTNISLFQDIKDVEEELKLKLAELEKNYKDLKKKDSELESEVKNLYIIKGRLQNDIDNIEGGRKYTKAIDKIISSTKAGKTFEKKIEYLNNQLEKAKTDKKKEKIQKKIDTLNNIYKEYIEDGTNRLNAEIKEVEAEIKKVDVKIKNNKIKMSQLGVDDIKKQLEDNESRKEMGVFLTGFTAKDDTLKAATGETKEMVYEQYYEEENKLYDDFLVKLKQYDNSDLDSRNLKKKIINEARKYIKKATPNQFVNYLFENDFGKTTHLHMYRAPRDCILIADEVHLQTCVSSNISLILQALWKYTSNTKYTIFCTATPMSAGDLFKQMYTLSKMLDEGEGDSRIPVWSIQGIRKARERDMPKLKNVFQAAKLMKYKISKHNTVDDALPIIKNIIEESNEDSEWKQNKKKNETNNWKEKKRYKFFLEPKKLLNAFVGQDPYKDVTSLGDIKVYLKEALKRVYLNNNNLLDNNLEKNAKKIFPTKILKSDIITTSNYLQQALSYYQPKRLISDLMNKTTGDTTYDLDINDNKIVVKEGNTYTVNQLKMIEALVLNNYTDALYTFYCQPVDFKNTPKTFLNHDFGSNPIFQNQTQWKGLKKDLLERLPTNVLNIFKRDKHDGLKYLYLHPNASDNKYDISTKLQMTTDEDDNAYTEDNYNLKTVEDKIPYIPELETGKFRKMIEFIEEETKKSKNIMIYFNKTNPPQALCKSLESRNHKHFKEINIEDEQYLEKHALQNALRRWRKWFIEGIDENYNDDDVWEWIMKQDREMQYVAKMIKDGKKEKQFNFLHPSKGIKTIKYILKTFNINGDEVEKWVYQDGDKIKHKSALKEYYDQWVKNNPIYINNIGQFENELEKYRLKLDWFGYTGTVCPLRDKCYSYPAKTKNVESFVELLVLYLEMKDILFGDQSQMIKHANNLLFCCKELLFGLSVKPVPTKELQIIDTLNNLNFGNTEIEILMEKIKQFIFKKIMSKRRRTENVELKYIVKEGNEYVFKNANNGSKKKPNPLKFMRFKARRKYQKYNQQNIRLIKDVITETYNEKIWKDKYDLKKYATKQTNYVLHNNKIYEVWEVKSRTEITGLELVDIDSLNYNRRKTENSNVTIGYKLDTQDGQVYTYWYIHTPEAIAKINLNTTISNKVYESDKPPVYEIKVNLDEKLLAFNCQNYKIRKATGLQEPTDYDKKDIDDDLESSIQEWTTKFLEFYYKHGHPAYQNQGYGMTYFYITKKNDGLTLLLDKFLNKGKPYNQNEDDDYIEYNNKKYIFDKKDETIKNRVKTLTNKNQNYVRRQYIKFIGTYFRRQDKKLEKVEQEFRSSQLKGKDSWLEKEINKLTKDDIKGKFNIERKIGFDKADNIIKKIQMYTYRKQVIFEDGELDKEALFDASKRLGKDMESAVSNDEINDLVKKYRYYFELIFKYHNDMIKKYPDKKEGDGKKYIFNLQGYSDFIKGDYGWFTKQMPEVWNSYELFLIIGFYYVFKKNLLSHFMNPGDGEEGLRIKKLNDVSDTHIQEINNLQYEIIFQENLDIKIKEIDIKIQDVNDKLNQLDDFEEDNKILFEKDLKNLEKDKIKLIDQLSNALKAQYALDTPDQNEMNRIKNEEKEKRLEDLLSKINQNREETPPNLVDSLYLYLNNPYSRAISNKVFTHEIDGKLYKHASEKPQFDALKDWYYELNGMQTKDRLTVAFFTNLKKGEQLKKLKKYFKSGGIDIIITNPNGIQGVDYKSCTESITICGHPFSSPANQDQYEGRLVRKNSHATIPDKFKTVESITFLHKHFYIDNSTVLTRGLPAMEGKTAKTIYKDYVLSNSKKLPEFPMIIPSTDEEYVKLKEYTQDKIDEWEEDKLGKTNSQINKIQKLIDDKKETHEYKMFSTLNNLESKSNSAENVKKRGYWTRFTPSGMKHWSDGFEKCINLAYVYCCENLVFLSKDLYDEYKKQKDENEAIDFSQIEINNRIITDKNTKKDNIREILNQMNLVDVQELNQKLNLNKNQITNLREQKNGLTSISTKLRTKEQNDRLNEIKVVIKELTSLNKDLRKQIKEIKTKNTELRKKKKELEKKYNECVESIAVLVNQNDNLKYLRDNVGNNHIYCYYCSHFGYHTTCYRCGEVLISNNRFKHYKLMKQPVYANNFLLNKWSGEVNVSNKTIIKKREKDRMELAMVFNSIEHLSKLQGDKTHRFEIKEEEKTKAFYKRCTGETIDTQQVQQWDELINQPEMKPRYNYVTEIQEAPRDYEEYKKKEKQLNFINLLPKNNDNVKGWSEDIRKGKVLDQISIELKIDTKQLRQFKKDNTRLTSKKIYDQLKLFSETFGKSIFFSNEYFKNQKKQRENKIINHTPNTPFDLIIKSGNKVFKTNREQYIQFWKGDKNVSDHPFHYWVDKNEFPEREPVQTAPEFKINDYVIIQGGDINIDQNGWVREVIEGIPNKYKIQLDNQPDIIYNRLPDDDKTYIESYVGSDTFVPSNDSNSDSYNVDSDSDSDSDWDSETGDISGANPIAFKIELEY